MSFADENPIPLVGTGPGNSAYLVDLAVLNGGPADWAAATGRDTEYGS